MLPGFLQLQTPDGYLFAGCVEFVTERERAVRQLNAFAHIRLPNSVTTVVVYKTTRDGHLRELRHSEFFETAILTQCIDIDVRTGAHDRWPLLEARYASFHQGNDWAGGIEWHALIEGESMSMIRRMPTRLWKNGRQGRAIRERFGAVEAAPGLIELRAASTGKTVQLQCDRSSCLVTPDQVLREDW
jgi:hypothetical protein